MNYGKIIFLVFIFTYPRLLQGQAENVKIDSDNCKALLIEQKSYFSFFQFNAIDTWIVKEGDKEISKKEFFKITDSIKELALLHDKNSRVNKLFLFGSLNGLVGGVIAIDPSTGKPGTYIGAGMYFYGMYLLTKVRNEREESIISFEFADSIALHYNQLLRISQP